MFKDLVFAFAQGVVEKEKSKWTRYIVAYNGEVKDDGSPGVTHLVCEEDEVRGTSGSCS